MYNIDTNSYIVFVYVSTSPERIYLLKIQLQCGSGKQASAEQLHKNKHKQQCSSIVAGTAWMYFYTHERDAWFNYINKY